MNNPSQPPQPAQPDMALLLLGSFFEDLHNARAGVAWISDHFVLGWVFFALGAVAALGIAERHWH
jgi:hypothetical protein